jgi:hypothetical protein
MKTDEERLKHQWKWAAPICIVFLLVGAFAWWIGSRPIQLETSSVLINTATADILQAAYSKIHPKGTKEDLRYSKEHILLSRLSQPLSYMYGSVAEVEKNHEITTLINQSDFEEKSEEGSFGQWVRKFEFYNGQKTVSLHARFSTKNGEASQKELITFVKVAYDFDDCTKFYFPQANAQREKIKALLKKDGFDPESIAKQGYTIDKFVDNDALAGADYMLYVKDGKGKTLASYNYEFGCDPENKKPFVSMSG